MLSDQRRHLHNPSSAKKSGKETPAPAPPTPPGPGRSWSNTKLSSLSLFGEAHKLQQLASRVRAPECTEDARMTFRTIVRDYCNHTAIHGFRYFFDMSRTPTERVFWVLAVFFSLGGCFYLMSKVWLKWELYPIMVTFKETTSSMWEIPFPAVTICPVIKSKKKLFDFTETRLKIKEKRATPEEIWRYDAMSMICEPELFDPMFPRTPDQFNRTPIDFFLEVAPTLEDVMLHCTWRFESKNCSELFRTVLTEEGVCFSFNALGPRELFAKGTLQWEEDRDGRLSSGWTEEDGYDNQNVGSNFPRRLSGIGPLSGLQLILRSYNSDIDYLCGGAELGFKVILHSPAQMGHLNQYLTILPHNASMHVVASPAVMTTSDSLRAYPPQRRACIFPTEEPGLRFYKLYSQENCLYECMANLTLLNCHCTLFSQPRFPGMQVCDQYLSCVEGNFEKIFLDNHTVSAPRYMPFPACNACLPSCISLSFKGDASVTKFPWREAMRALQLNINSSDLSISRLKVYPQNMQFIASQRREMYGHADFLANCGGLLGLFSGFSVVSLVEIVYYASLRLVCHIRRGRAAELKRRCQAQHGP